MANEILGRLNCAICGNSEATIHRQGGKHNALYYRCYVTAGSNDMRCGTIQCLGPTGQAFLGAMIENQNNPIAKPVLEPPQKIAPERKIIAPNVAIAKNTETQPNVRRSFLDKFWAGDEE